MRWEDERYVRLYTRDSTTWLKWTWEARATFALLLRKVDRSGRLALDGEPVADAIALHTGLPVDVVERGLAQITRPGKDGEATARVVDGALELPNFEHAQTTRSSDAKRSQEYRDRKRQDEASRNVTPEPASVTPTVTPPPPVTLAVPSGAGRGGAERKTDTPRAGARSPVDVAWSTAAGTLSADLGDLLRLRDHVDACAEDAGRDADELFTAAVVEFKALRETFTNGKIPTLSPRKLLEHWPSVWERITGTAPSGKAPAVAAKHDPKKGRAPVGDFTGERSREVKW